MYSQLNFYIRFNIINFLSINDIFNFILINKENHQLINNLNNKYLLNFNQKNFVETLLKYLEINKIPRINWMLNRNEKFNRNVLISCSLLFCKNIKSIEYFFLKYKSFTKYKDIERIIGDLILYGGNKSHNKLYLKSKVNILEKNHFLHDLIIDKFILQERDHEFFNEFYHKILSSKIIVNYFKRKS